MYVYRYRYWAPETWHPIVVSTLKYNLYILTPEFFWRGGRRGGFAIKVTGLNFSEVCLGWEM